MAVALRPREEAIRDGMTLILAIENLDRMPDGGPLRFEARARGLDIGRDAHLDWTLPDPDRIVSSKHCEIRFRDGAYWLTDVSTNGTFLNGSTQRLAAPTRLNDKDRLAIGRYIVSVSIQDGAKTAPSPEPSFAAPAFGAPANVAPDIWGGGEAAPPESRAAFRPNPPPRAQADFLDFAAPLQPVASASPSFAIPASAGDPWGVASAPEPPPRVFAPPPPASPAAPSPRRPAPPADSVFAVTPDEPAAAPP